MRHFLNDSDGLSRKDYLLLLSSTVFFGFVFVGLILVLFGYGIEPTYIQLLDMVSPVIMTIVGGLFGVEITQEIRKPRGNKPDEQVDYNDRV